MEVRVLSPAPISFKGLRPFFPLMISVCDKVSKLQNNNIDLFIDIRIRRGMRGSKYSFVNSTYLQKKLKMLGVDYLHCKELAPTDEIRALQKGEDKKNNVIKYLRIFLPFPFFLGEIMVKYLSGPFFTGQQKTQGYPVGII
ncbi:MAG: DUF488 family protein [Clostridiales bacterium]|nr:DUF488 family protein [Clostridiales bacterium]